MNIRIDAHTLLRARERGTDANEIADVVNTGFHVSAKNERIGKAKIYPYHAVRNKKYYEQKKVEVYYVQENDTIITVTVYVFYGQWEGQP